jgi:hypothetical protein
MQKFLCVRSWNAAASASLEKYTLDSAYKLLQLQRTPLAVCVLPCSTAFPVYSLSLNNYRYFSKTSRGRGRETRRSLRLHMRLLTHISCSARVATTLKFKKRLLCQGSSRACQGNSPKCNPTKERLISRCEMTSLTCMNCCCSSKAQSSEQYT